ncbi:MAG: SPOR domain-containing protein [Thiomonas sp.]
MTFGVSRNSARRSPTDDTADTQSLDALRARARRRLIGAVALVLAAVIVFPLVFDSKPKPVPSNIALDIPAQTKVPALSLPASAPMLATASAPAAAPGEHAFAARAASAPRAVQPPAASKPAAVAPAAAPKPAPAASRPQVNAAQPQAAAAPAAARPAAPPASQAAAKAAAAPKAALPAQQSRELASARQALAALEGKTPEQISLAQAEAALAHPSRTLPEDAAPSKTRYVVQAGAYADAHTAQTVRAKIEKAGLATYTQVVDTPQGKRVRVRVGPFATRDAAERALHKLQALGIGGAVLTL